MNIRALSGSILLLTVSSLLAQWAEITPQGAVLVPAGEYRAAGRAVKVAQAVTLVVAPAPTITVSDEPVKLSVDKPVGWSKGTRLRGCNARDVNASGSSVTADGNASKPEFRYSDVFAAGLRERFPQAKIEMQNISAGGSHSRQWLYPDKFRYRDKPWQETGVTWQRIADAKPDLVTLEFVNDAGLPPPMVDEVYNDILKRVQGLGAELILITPHFTMWRMMGFKGMREAERRPYVLAIREFAAKHNIALADAAARWEHLWKEGLPYLALLHNTINHPDDRGHRLFAEELWTCFKE